MARVEAILACGDRLECAAPLPGSRGGLGEDLAAATRMRTLALMDAAYGYTPGVGVWSGGLERGLKRKAGPAARRSGVSGGLELSGATEETEGEEGGGEAEGMEVDGGEGEEAEDAASVAGAPPSVQRPRLCVISVAQSVVDSDGVVSSSAGEAAPAGFDGPGAPSAASILFGRPQAEEPLPVRRSATRPLIWHVFALAFGFQPSLLLPSGCLIDEPGRGVPVVYLPTLYLWCTCGVPGVCLPTVFPKSDVGSFLHTGALSDPSLAPSCAAVWSGPFLCCCLVLPPAAALSRDGGGGAGQQ